ncbi:MAG: hypothetical protein ACLQHF_16695 [Terracidiphilus sp.]
MQRADRSREIVAFPGSSLRASKLILCIYADGPDASYAVILKGEREQGVFEPLRFIWNATRGHRLTPWRSDYLRWRIETYSGKRADTLTASSIFSFIWASRWELLSFLAWTGQVEREARRRP